jgi:hypothetical protein
MIVKPQEQHISMERTAQSQQAFPENFPLSEEKEADGI